MKMPLPIIPPPEKVRPFTMLAVYASSLVIVTIVTIISLYQLSK